MSFHQKFFVGNEPVSALGAGTHSGHDITIQNLSETNTVYLGAEGVSPQSFGYAIFPRTAFSIELPPRDYIHLVSDNDGADVAIFRTGLE